MTRDHALRSSARATGDASRAAHDAPGKRTLVEAIDFAPATCAPISRKAATPAAPHDTEAVMAAAVHATSGTAGPLPYLSRIQAAFGRHDVTGVRAYVGGSAEEGASRMGARAFATGDQVAFGAAPDLHTAAHEAAHVVQQRGGVQLAGGVGSEGDPYERHADAVADLVVQGRSGEALLDPYAGRSGGGASRAVQRLQLHGTQWSSVGTIARTDGAAGAVIVHDLVEGEPSLILKFTPRTEQVSEAHGELHALGVTRTPGARRIDDRKEHAAVIDMLTRRAAEIPDQTNQKKLALQMIDKDAEITVMTFDGHAVPTEHLAQTPTNDKFYYELGLIAAYDQFTGNHDRIKVQLAQTDTHAYHEHYPALFQSANLLAVPSDDEGGMLPVPIDNPRVGVEKSIADKKLDLLLSIPQDKWNFAFGTSSGLLIAKPSHWEAFHAGLQEGIRVLKPQLHEPGKPGKNERCSVQ